MTITTGRHRIPYNQQIRPFKNIEQTPDIRFAFFRYVTVGVRSDRNDRRGYTTNAISATLENVHSASIIERPVTTINRLQIYSCNISRMKRKEKKLKNFFLRIINELSLSRRHV